MNVKKHKMNIKKNHKTLLSYIVICRATLIYLQNLEAI